MYRVSAGSLIIARRTPSNRQHPFYPHVGQVESEATWMNIVKNREVNVRGLRDSIGRDILSQLALQ